MLMASTWPVTQERAFGETNIEKQIEETRPSSRAPTVKATNEPRLSSMFKNDTTVWLAVEL